MTCDTIPIPGGYIKLMRTNATRELLQDPKAFALLTTIALRAKRTDDFNIHGLQPGQALIGDYASCGLTRRQYRTAIAHLEKYGLARFKGTSRGTIATLVGISIYDINEERAGQRSGQQQANDGPAGGQRATTIKKEKKEKKEKKDNSIGAMDIARQLARGLLDLVRQRKADFKAPNLDRWARDIERMIRLDGRDPERIDAVIRWCQRDPFWQNNILSAAKLRQHFDTLELRMQASPPPAETAAEMYARMEREGKL